MSNLTSQDFCQDTIELKRHLEGGFIDLGRRLYQIKQKEMWYDAGWSSFDEFTAELKMSPANCSKLISVYEKFVLEYNIPEQKLIEIGSWSSLYSIGAKTETKEEAEDWIDKARLMRREDIQSELKSKSVGEHTHEWSEIHIRQCSICGERQKIYDDE